MSYVRCVRGLASGIEYSADQPMISTRPTACLAALPQLLDRGLLRRGERVVAVNTGSAEKYLPALRHLMD